MSLHRKTVKYMSSGIGYTMLLIMVFAFVGIAVAAASNNWMLGFANSIVLVIVGVMFMTVGKRKLLGRRR